MCASVFIRGHTYYSVDMKGLASIIVQPVVHVYYSINPSWPNFNIIPLITGFMSSKCS